MRREIVSAYVAAGARIGSWALVSALVYRELSPAAFAVLALVRATIGLLNYAAVGLGPALIRMIAEESSRPRPVIPLSDDPAVARVLEYRGPEPDDDPARRVYRNGLVIAGVAGAIGVALTWFYAEWFTSLHRIETVKGHVPGLVRAIGLGTVMRLISDAPGAVLQARGRIAIDNLLLASSDLLWLLLAAWSVDRTDGLNNVGAAFLVSNLLLLTARFTIARRIMPWVRGMHFDPAILRRLLTFGGLVVLAQLADYLYAPTDYILIDALLDPMNLAAYAPAVQIDAAMLVLVSGVAMVLLPRSALAHAAGDAQTVRRYYVRGSLASLGLLLAAALVVWALSPWLLRLWLGNPMPATQAILPLVLVHTVIGGASIVGRSILLGMGKVRAFTGSVLIAGAGNVGLSFVFVRCLDLGLKGIVLGTIVAVTLRCVLWMPWYVLRSLKQGAPVAITPQAEAGG